LRAQTEALLARVRAADEAEQKGPEVDIPPGIARRGARLAAIAAARERLEARQREANLKRGRGADDENKPRGKDGKLKGGRHKRDLGVPQEAAQENFTDHDNRIMQTEAGRKAYARRKWLAEPPNGWIKDVLGFRQFSMRGLPKFRAEWKLVCLALNLRRMATMQGA
jgi:hypothetical protein